MSANPPSHHTTHTPTLFLSSPDLPSSSVSWRSFIPTFLSSVIRALSSSPEITRLVATVLLKRLAGLGDIGGDNRTSAKWAGTKPFLTNEFNIRKWPHVFHVHSGSSGLLSVTGVKLDGTRSVAGIVFCSAGYVPGQRNASLMVVEASC